MFSTLPHPTHPNEDHRLQDGARLQRWQTSETLPDLNGSEWSGRATPTRRQVQGAIEQLQLAWVPTTVADTQRICTDMLRLPAPQAADTTHAFCDMLASLLADKRLSPRQASFFLARVADKAHSLLQHGDIALAARMQEAGIRLASAFEGLTMPTHAKDIGDGLVPGSFENHFKRFRDASHPKFAKFVECTGLLQHMPVTHWLTHAERLLEETPRLREANVISNAIYEVATLVEVRERQFGPRAMELPQARALLDRCDACCAHLDPDTRSALEPYLKAFREDLEDEHRLAQSLTNARFGS